MISQIRLCRRRINWFRQLVGFLKPFWKADSAHCPVFLIALPTASCNISAHNAFDWKHRQLFALHALSFKFFCLKKLRHIRRICRKHMVRNNAARIVKPKTGHFRQYGSLVWNHIFQNIVKCRDPVCCHNNQAVTVIIYLTYFAFFHWFKLCTHDSILRI